MFLLWCLSCILCKTRHKRHQKLRWTSSTLNYRLTCTWSTLWHDTRVQQQIQPSPQHLSATWPCWIGLLALVSQPSLHSFALSKLHCLPPLYVINRHLHFPSLVCYHHSVQDCRLLMHKSPWGLPFHYLRIDTWGILLHFRWQSTTFLSSYGLLSLQYKYQVFLSHPKLCSASQLENAYMHDPRSNSIALQAL